MKKIIATALYLFTIITTTVAYADDLLSIYQQALASDPAFKVATATYLAAKENLPISQANLLPNFNGNIALNREHEQISGLFIQSPQFPLVLIPGSFYSTGVAYSLNLTQPIFNYANWMAVSSASAGVKQAGFTYQAAAQDLILRTATAYFNVLQASDVLRLIQAERRSIYRQLEDARHRYKVGLIPVTSFYEAKSRYYIISAQEITAINDLAIRKEQLREIIGIESSALAALKTTAPFLKPTPADINLWMKKAEEQNSSLLAARFATIAARENIKVQQGGHLPIINFTSSYQYAQDSNPNGDGFPFTGKTALLGVSADVPIYQGGLVSAQVRQAHGLYQKASSEQEQAHRQVISQTRQAYLSVIDAISTIYADKQAIISNKSNYQAMAISYRFGTRTMTDLLNAEAKVYESERDLAVAQYNYIIQSLTLKQAAGLLSIDDIYAVNKWLYGGHSEIKMPSLKIKKVCEKERSAKAIRSARKFTAHERYLLSLNPQHYILQLAAISNAKTIPLFLKSHSTPRPIFYVRVSKNEKILYKILTGDYVDFQSAETAKNQLAQKWNDKSIWIRKVSDLQAEVATS